MEFIKKGNEGGGINDNDEDHAFIHVSDLPNKDSIKENKTRKEMFKKNYKFEEEKKVNNKNIKNSFNFYAIWINVILYSIILFLILLFK